MERRRCSATFRSFGDAVFQQVWLLYAGIGLIVLTALVLRYTSLGIAMHAAGAEPRAVDKSGLSVTRIRYRRVLFAGFMSALAGAFLSIGDIHTFTEGMTSGAGYLAIAAVIFGKWTIERHGRWPVCCLARRRRCSFSCRRSGSTCRTRF